MEYRYLGPTGLRVSVIGFGNWVNSNKEDQKENTAKCVKVAFEAGVNFFDTAEIYGKSFLKQDMEKLKDKWAKHCCNLKHQESNMC